MTDAEPETPPVCYVDTSALVKRYVTEPGTDEFEAFCARPGLDPVICPLGVTELSSVLRTHLRGGRLTLQQIGQMRQRFHSDLASGGWRLVSFDPLMFTSAETLINELGAPLATLDAAHLACALAHRASDFATADRQLAAAARKAKLRVHLF